MAGFSPVFFTIRFMEFINIGPVYIRGWAEGALGWGGWRQKLKQTVDYTVCVLFLFVYKRLPPPTPPPRPSCPPPNIHWLNINEFHQKIVKKLAKTSHYLLVRLVVQ